MSGIGVQSAGASPGGLGDPNENPRRRGVVFRDTRTGLPMSARRIDPGTKRYVLDEFGRITGMTAAQQGVHLAVSTDLGTAAVREIGNRLKSIKTIVASFQRELETVYTDALARLTQAGLVQIVDVTSKRVGSSRAYVQVRWRDLSTGAIRTTEVRN